MGTLPAAAGEDRPDAVTQLVLAWLTGKRSPRTRAAYAADIGVTLPGRRRGPARARLQLVPPWLPWCAGIGTDPLAATEEAVTLYARALEASGLASSTAARKLSAVAGWYAWLTRRGYIAASPAAAVSRPAVDPDVSSTPGLTRDQAAALLAAAGAGTGPQCLRTAALIYVLVFTGARVSEITGADVEDLGADRGHRVLWVTRKGGRRQALPLPAPAAQRVDTYLASRGDVRAVPALQGQPGGRPSRRVLFATASGARMFAADVWRLVRRLAAAAGLPAELVARLGPHAVRHAYATLALDAGVSLRDLQDAMGHADPRTTRRYDRARYSLDRSPGYALAGYLAPVS